MRPLTLTLPVLAAIALSSCAAPGAEQTASVGSRSDQQCFYSDDVRAFSDAGPGVALVSIGASDTWELTLTNGCPSVANATKIGIVSRGRTKICSGADAELIIPTASGAGSQRCLVRNVRKLSPEESAQVRSAAPKP